MAHDDALGAGGGRSRHEGAAGPAGRRRRSTTALGCCVTATVLTAGLSACAGSEPRPPAEAALEACRNAAVQQFDVEDAGGATEPRELAVPVGESFEVTGDASGVQWVCTWTRTEAADGVTVEVSIDER